MAVNVSQRARYPWDLPSMLSQECLRPLTKDSTAPKLLTSRKRPFWNSYMPAEDLSTAISALERRLAEHERKGNELKGVINVLLEEAGLPAKFPELGASGTTPNGGTLTQIKRDSFYGKKQMTAIREYLEMRRAQGNGPATPREIVDALKAGGYQFEAKSVEIALVGLRAVLRKATTVFHKLPGTGMYGLTSWYPDARAARGADDGDARPAKAKSARAKSAKKAARGRPGKPAKGSTTAGTQLLLGKAQDELLS
jgi:hypothetical protein